MIKKLLAALASGALALSVTAQAATRYVDPSNVASHDSGAGDATHPYKTIHFAMSVLLSGDTLNIAGGTYRETMKLPTLSGVQTVIQLSSAAAKVLIKGSDVVGGWQSLGNGVYVKHSWSTNTQQVFIDGEPLQQIGGTIFNMDPFIWPARINGTQANLVNDSFYYDATGLALYIKTPLASLSGHTVEASVRTFAIFGDQVHNLTIRNLHVQHSNTTATNQNGAVTLIGGNLTIAGLIISHADGAGTDITGNNNVVQNVIANYNGQVGMKVRGNNNKVLNNMTNFNNTRGFNKNWEAGGAKFTGANGLTNSEVAGHRAIGNKGDGIWFDFLNDSNKIHGSLSAYNSGFGIHYEASQRGYIYNNTIYGNNQRGIYLPCSSNSVVAYNLILSNGPQGIVAIDDGRSASRAVLVPANNMFFGNIVGWSKEAAITVPVGVLNNTSNYNVIVEPGQPFFAVGFSPLIPGLANWQTKSGQDRNSVVVTQAVPSALATAFASRDIRANLSALVALGAHVTVPKLSINVPVQTRAGPLAQIAPFGTTVATAGGAADGTSVGSTGSMSTAELALAEGALAAEADDAATGEGGIRASANRVPAPGTEVRRVVFVPGFYQRHAYNAAGQCIATSDQAVTYL